MYRPETDREIRAYLDLIKEALSTIDAGYFRLATTYEPSGITRERIFCYELYHQIRSRMPEGCPLTLNGEIDKRGHIEFDRKDQKNPDFVFHIPGTMEGNTLLVEVKGTLDYSVKDITDDLETALRFVSKYRYVAGLFILYNHNLRELRAKIKDRLADLSCQMDAERVYVLCIREAHQPCEEAILSHLEP